PCKRLCERSVAQVEKETPRHIVATCYQDVGCAVNGLSEIHGTVFSFVFPQGAKAPNSVLVDATPSPRPANLVRGPFSLPLLRRAREVWRHDRLVGRRRRGTGGGAVELLARRPRGATGGGAGPSTISGAARAPGGAVLRGGSGQRQAARPALE